MDNDELLQQRHRPASLLDRPRELIIACPPMRSNVNISRIVRAAGCCGVRRVIACGTAKVVDKIARDAGGEIAIDVYRTLPPVLKRLRDEGYQLVALEQTSESECIYDFPYEYKTVLVVGNERHGVAEDVLKMVNRTIEIPIYGKPDSHNAASATIMAMYEYCRQFPSG